MIDVKEEGELMKREEGMGGMHMHEVDWNRIKGVWHIMAVVIDSHIYAHAAIQRMTSQESKPS